MQQKAASVIAKTRFGRQLASSQRSRILLSAAVSLALNLLYAIYHLVVGILNFSFWFIAMGAFYGIFATMRFSAVLCARNHQKSPDNDAESFVMKLSGILFIALAGVLAAINAISLSQNIVTRHDGVIMITIATYTFCKITAAIMKAVKQRKDPSALFRTIRSIGYAETAASILTLQRSMLISFGSMRAGKIHFMNAATGAAVCSFVLILGASMIIRSKRKECEPWQNPNL